MRGPEKIILVYTDQYNSQQNDWSMIPQIPRVTAFWTVEIMTASLSSRTISCVRVWWRACKHKVGGQEQSVLSVLADGA